MTATVPEMGWVYHRHPIETTARERLDTLLYGLPMLNLRSEVDRAILKARCFKIKHLCIQIEPLSSRLPSFPIADGSEVGLLLDLAKADSDNHKTSALSTIWQRAAALEDLL